MKKIVILVLMFVGVTALAQKPERKDRGAKANHMKAMSAEQMATLQTKKMTLHLDLTEAQQKQIKALNLENAKLRKEKMAARQAKKEAGDMKKPSTEERYAMANERLNHQIAMKSKMKEILSDEQFAKWDKMHHRRSMGRKGMKGQAKKRMKSKEKN